MLTKIGSLRFAALGATLLWAGASFGVDRDAVAQSGAPAPAAVKQIGTVQAVTGSTLALKTDAGQSVSVNVADGTRLLQLAPGSTNLKDAQTITLAAIAVGDRVLVTGKAGADPSSIDASRVILMKSSDIAQKHATEQADWEKRGLGGIVTAVNAGTGTLTISEGAKKIAVNTSSKTDFRRYAGDSVKFEDARPGNFNQIQAGDQLRVRGEKSADGASIAAEEIISGSFKHLSGIIASISATGETLTLKDLATKKVVTVKVVANSTVRALPASAAAKFAARAKGGAATGGQSHGASEHAGQASGEGEAAQERSAGIELSQLVSRLPNETLADLKAGDAVMIVASQPDPGSPTVTAVTVLSGVEPILAATPNGSQGMTLSPWNIGGGAGDGGTP